MHATTIVKDIRPSPQTPGQVGHEFRKLVDSGLPIRTSGSARTDPTQLLSMGYTPKHKVQLFDTTYYLTNMRYDDDLRFMVAYVIAANPGRLAN